MGIPTLRRLAAALLCVICAAGAAGCFRSSTLAGDTSQADAHPDRGEVPADTVEVEWPRDVPAEPREDSPAGCDIESHWVLAPRPIASVALVDMPSPRAGTTERLVVEVELASSCEFLGELLLRYNPGDATDFVGLAAFAWVPTGIDCLPVAPIVKRIVTIPGRAMQGNPNVVVTDENSPGGGLRLTYGREFCTGGPACECHPGSPDGTAGEMEDCLTDCSCRAGLSCVGYHGVAGPLRGCMRPCNSFTDCNPREDCIPPIPDAPPYICAYNGDLCLANGDCPPGFTCTFTDLASFCADTREAPAARACACDGQCPAGQRCLLALRDEPACEIPCLSDGDCPSPPGTGPLVCGTKNICLPLEH